MKEDLTGKVFNRLTVVELAGKNNRGELLWKCVCVCGKNKIAIYYDLKSNHTKSCGCLRVDTITKIRRVHGMSNTPEYETWLGMLKRCNNPKSEDYKDYGLRGIKVCDNWVESFNNFFNDMGYRPSINHSINRLDNNGNYNPENCNWATVSQQMRNKRNNIWIEFNGEVKILEDWATALNVTRSVAGTIIKNNSKYKILKNV